MLNSIPWLWVLATIALMHFTPVGGFVARILP